MKIENEKLFSATKGNYVTKRKYFFFSVMFILYTIIIILVLGGYLPGIMFPQSIKNILLMLYILWGIFDTTLTIGYWNRR